MGKPLTITIPHDLGQAEARRRIEQGFGRVEQQLAGAGATNFTQTWEGDRLSFAAKVMGQAIAGRLHVLDKAVNMEIDLPGVLGLIAGKIKGKLEREGQLLLEKK